MVIQIENNISCSVTVKNTYLSSETGVQVSDVRQNRWMFTEQVEIKRKWN